MQHGLTNKEGALHQPPQGLLVPVLNELGVIGLICPDETHCLSFLSIFLPSLAMQSLDVIPSPSYPPLPMI